MSRTGGALDGRRVLVTGATGFIGGRLAHRLATEEGAVVTGTGRRLDAAAALAAQGVRLVEADLRDEAALARVLEGQELVFHAAAWMGSTRSDAASAQVINVDAVRTLARLADRAGVRHFVHLSSIAVYGACVDGPVPEDTPPDLVNNDIYGRTKALGEQALREAAGTMLVAIVRPGMVYGPGSRTWTATLARMIARGVPVLFGAADGHAEPVYIDDLVDLVLLAAVREEAAGETFNCVDRPVPWSELFAHYGRMVGRRPRRIPLRLAWGLATANEWLHLGLPLNRNRLRHYMAHPVFLTDKAQERLGWVPRVDLDEGMRRSAEWLRQIGQPGARR